MFSGSVSMYIAFSLQGWMDELDANDVSLLKAVKLLRWITEQRVNKSAVEELKKEKKIHEIFHENEKFKKNIEKFKQQLKSQRINLRWKLATEESYKELLKLMGVSYVEAPLATEDMDALTDFIKTFHV
ncbi:hypothetical protein GQX74_000628 [Glossina fuscipes]|nr:hypothetical protein GQX74_000628 [Glossina fuscipes]